MRRSDHPNRPSAITCCFLSSLKTLLTLTQGNSRVRINVLDQTFVGRFSSDNHWPHLSDYRGKQALAKRGEHPGLICIFSAMEPCSTYKPWHNKQTGQTYLVSDDGKCLHYYFYFVDEELGLCHVRVPTWLPCRLQVCFNGHN